MRHAFGCDFVYVAAIAIASVRGVVVVKGIACHDAEDVYEAVVWASTVSKWLERHRKAGKYARYLGACKRERN